MGVRVLGSVAAVNTNNLCKSAKSVGEPFSMSNYVGDMNKKSPGFIAEVRTLFIVSWHARYM